MPNFYQWQKDELAATASRNKVAYYHDMGLGKTFTGAEKAMQLGKTVLCVCQKSKVDDWVYHFAMNYSACVFNLTRKNEYAKFIADFPAIPFIPYPFVVAVINYDILYRRTELKQLSNFTLLLDESSLITNENAKRSKFILNKLRPENIILLSGTPTNGKSMGRGFQLK